MTRKEFDNLPIGKHNATMYNVRGKLNCFINAEGEREYFFELSSEKKTKYSLTPILLVNHNSNKVLATRLNNGFSSISLAYSEIELFQTNLQKAFNWLFPKPKNNQCYAR